MYKKQELICGFLKCILFWCQENAFNFSLVFPLCFCCVLFCFVVLCFVFCFVLLFVMFFVLCYFFYFFYLFVFWALLGLLLLSLYEEKLEHPAKHLILKTGANRFGTTWGWVNDVRIFIFVWTIPLYHTCLLCGVVTFLTTQLLRTTINPSVLLVQWTSEDICCGWTLTPESKRDEEDTRLLAGRLSFVVSPRYRRRDQVQPQIRLMPELPVIDGWIDSGSFVTV